VPDQHISDARDFIYGDVYDVDQITDCKIAVDPTSRARPKAHCLFFYVNWSPPHSDPSENTWEPMRNLVKLAAFKTFLRSHAWQAFAASDDYKAFARKYPKKIPKVVHFADD
jgi:hypothetical protein